MSFLAKGGSGGFTPRSRYHRPMPSIPRVLLHLEGALVLGLSLWLYTRYGSGWVMFAALILAPDIAMLGYLVNADLGAKFYDGAGDGPPPRRAVRLGPDEPPVRAAARPGRTRIWAPHSRPSSP